MAVYKLKDLTEDYDVHEVLGKGQYGVCRRACSRATRAEVAVKSISKLKIRTDKDKQEVEQEIAIMRHLAGHPNVVRLFDVYEDAGHIHLVMELCKGGELFDQIIKKGYYSEKQAADLVRVMLHVIKHMHSLGVIHRDLKPENFLFDRPFADVATMKATDFGLSTFISPNQKLHECVGSSYYISPEVLQRDYGTEADIWSAGVILYILLCGSPPFYGSNDKEILQMILNYKDGNLNFRFQPWPLVSQGARECILMMLRRDTKERATIDEILNHSWMRENGTASSEPFANEVVSRLQNFLKMSKLQRMASRMMASMLSPSELNGLRKLFEKFDADNDGNISVDELHRALREWGLPQSGGQAGATKRGAFAPATDTTHLKQEVERIMQELDVDRSGTIDLDEFIGATMSLCQLETEENLARAFKQIDANGDGFLTRDELREALHRFNLFDGDKDIDKIISDVDKDKDGRIDYSEFLDSLCTGQGQLAICPSSDSTGKSPRAKKIKTSVAIHSFDNLSGRSMDAP